MERIYFEIEKLAFWLGRRVQREIFPRKNLTKLYPKTSTLVINPTETVLLCRSLGFRSFNRLLISGMGLQGLRGTTLRVGSLPKRFLLTTAHPTDTLAEQGTSPSSSVGAFLPPGLTEKAQRKRRDLRRGRPPQRHGSVRQGPNREHLGCCFSV